MANNRGPAYAVSDDTNGADLITHPDEHTRRHKNTEFVNAKDKSRFQLKFAFTLLRRLIVFAAAIVYLQNCLLACIDAIHVMRGGQNPVMNFSLYKSPLIQTFVGTGTLRESPLVKLGLNDDTTPRAGTIYLENGNASFTPCQYVDLPPRIYDNDFLHSMHAAFVHDVAYNLTFMDASVNELIAPVVDCSSSAVIWRDDTAVRLYFLTRMLANRNDVYMLTATMSVQEYMVPAENEHGVAGISTVTFVNDMRVKEMSHRFVLSLGYPYLHPTLELFELDGVTPDSVWSLKSVPKDPSTTKSKIVLTACRTGFFFSSPSEQSNIRNVLWELSNDPITVLSRWQWVGRAVLRDSWAWVHFIHFIFAFDVFINLLVLLVVVYRNFHAGKIWIGDAFVAVSTTLWLRSALVLLSWWINGFWSINEFSIQTGNLIAGRPGYFLIPAMARADLLALYFCLVACIGNVLKERIDPAITIGLFYWSFDKRVSITKLFSQLADKAAKFSIHEYSLAMSDVDPGLANISPVRVWSAHHVPPRDASFMLAVLFPIFSTCIFIVAYAVLRKVYRAFFPDKLLVQRITGMSEDEEQLIQLKRNLTMFEIATGAALQNHYGIVADYNNCLYVKGVKYASADGIYSSGYLIANGKFLIQTEDLVSIWLMKILRKRFRNLYAYEVDGATVKQQAQLVYPETFTFTDLVCLNVDNLS